ncbi:hypothetical protein [Paraglaciecola sp. 20A4]|uniref:hypothetical protein n=1 Tax=Paraglaciecola sp. 20A4 TaxID=2687288 RepID=UPI001407412B|nr:hypothetical protein [Paraglaciecola sp. 20A4]
MLKKEQVIIHIGLHKTGTTTIQQFMSDNRAKLIDVDYVCHIGNGDYREDGNSYFLLKQENWYDENRSYKLDIALLIANIKNSKKNRVMLSTEGLSWCSDKEQLQTLKNELLLVSDNILILVYVRSPVSLAVSNFSEGLKYPNSVSILTDYDHACLSVESLKSEISYEHYTFKNILNWQEVFSHSLLVREFNVNSFYKNNLLADILNILDLNGDSQLLKSALLYQRQNESFNMLQVYYLVAVHRLSNKLPDTHRVKSLLFELIKHKLHWLKSDKKFHFDKINAELFTAKIKDDVLIANDKLGIDNINLSYKVIEKSPLSVQDYFKLSGIFLIHLSLLGIYIITKIYKKLRLR